MSLIRFLSRARLYLFAATLLTSDGLAQASKDNPTDAAWKGVVDLTVPAKVVAEASSIKKSVAQAETDRQAQRDRLKLAATTARAFYTTYPSDPRVPQAKKIEVVAGLRGASNKDTDLGQNALQVAQAYRSAPSNSVADRFEVAALMERQKFSLQNGGKVVAKDTVQHERIADSLRTEFGDIPEVYAFYLGVVNTADPENAQRVAHKIQLLPAPAFAKTEAKVTTDRHALVGKKLNQSYKDAEGKSFVLGATGRPTVVYVWSPVTTPNALKYLAATKFPAAEQARWVYVATNATAGSLDLTKKQAPYVGIHCLELPVSGGPLSSALKNRRLPYVYVLGSDGALVGYGDPADLVSLLRKAK